MISGLAKHDVRPEDIHYVVCSHSHADHIGNNNLFLEAKEHIVGTTVQHNTLFHERNIKNCKSQLKQMQEYMFYNILVNYYQLFCILYRWL